MPYGDYVRKSEMNIIIIIIVVTNCVLLKKYAQYETQYFLHSIVTRVFVFLLLLTI
jgi:uncharacterized membrane protein